MSDARWLDMAPAFVLDMLDEAEARAFEDRLGTDEALQAEVRAQREVLGVIADGTEHHSPRPELKDRILQQARASRPMQGSGSGETDVRPISSAPSAADGGRRRGVLFPAIATAATLAALALGLSYDRLSDRTAQLESQLDDLRASLQNSDAALAARDSLLQSFLGSDVRSVTLTSTGEQPSARIFQNVATGSVVIAAFDLPPAPEGRVYQLWGIADGENPVSLGTFQTNADGTAILRRSVPAGSAFAIGAVTEEPTGGSPQPTQTPFLVGTWSGD